MQLTDTQVAIAESLGCRLVPATEAQVRQFAMQRRVFQVGGKPFVVMREDGFYETAGTLLALIANYQPPEKPSAPPAEITPPPAEATAEVAPPEPAPPSKPLPEAEPVVTAEAPQPAAEPQPAAVEPAPADNVMSQASLPLPEPSRAARRRPAAPAVKNSPAPALEPFSPATQPEVVAAMRTITQGYAAGHQLDGEQLSTLLQSVHQSLSKLSRRA